MTMKVRDVLTRLADEGWILDRQRGSHRQFTHPSKPGARVTVAGHPADTLGHKTLAHIFTQAGWK